LNGFWALKLERLNSFNKAANNQKISGNLLSLTTRSSLDLKQKVLKISLWYF